MAISTGFQETDTVAPKAEPTRAQLVSCHLSA